jgi:dihydroorotate dehydrogenase
VLTTLAKPAVQLLSCLDPERAHSVIIWALEHGFGRGLSDESNDPILATELWGFSLTNPIGLAAGFDKDARVFSSVLQLGFGSVEVGTITPRPQIGNSKPRIFRLPEEGAVINRLGFNSGGVELAARRLAVGHSGIVGANIGMNRDSTDPRSDYSIVAGRVAPFVDYIAVNVSSPNTPGLRALQERGALADIIESVVKAVSDSVLDRSIPVAIKVSPDVSQDELGDIVDVALSRGAAGLIISNTTTERPASLRGQHKGETGGLSGRPLFRTSTELLHNAYRMSGGRLPLVGTGGIENGMDAYAKIRAGASMVQLYSALIYGGPVLVGKIKREMAACLRADGCSCVADAIGADHR